MDLSNYIPKTASCPDFGDWACKYNYDIPWSKAKRGDIVLFDFNKNRTSDHIGIVTKVTSSYIETVEGNTGNGSNTNGDGVYRRTRYKSQVNYFVRPKMPESYRELIIATAESQVGYKEGRSNDNKYGRAFGANKCAWCCIFVWWCFKNCKGAIEKVEKPTGFHTIYLSSDTLKLGSKGTGVKKLQQFLNWYHPEWKLKEDGEFGNLTDEAARAFQRAEGLTVDGIFGANSRKKANAYLNVPQATPKPIAPVKKKYTGEFPDFVKLSGTIISDLAKSCAYPKGTAKKKYRFTTGKPFGKFKEMLNKAYPNRSKWGTLTKAGASCDVFVGTIIRASGMDKDYPRGIEDGQMTYRTKNFEVLKNMSLANLRAGDIVRFLRKGGGGHTLVIVDVGGVLYKAEASYSSKGNKYALFGHISSKVKTYKASSYKKCEVIRCTHAIRNYLQFGDHGEEVKKLQKFLNWYGGYGLKVDGDYGAKTRAAVREFQLKQGLSGDGMFGVVSLKKAKEIER